MRIRIMMFCMLGMVAGGCLQNGQGGGGGASSGISFTGSGSSSKPLGNTVIPGQTNSETQCLTFKNNTTDYNSCIGCKLSLCPCTNRDTVTGKCLDTAKDLGGCTVNSAQLIACVHNNVVSAGGPCVGLKCADGQIADFTSCLCRDATPPSSIGPAPGYEDSTTPYVQPGFFITDRFCGPPDISTTVKDECLLSSLNDATLTSPGQNTGATPSPGTPPKYAQQSPANVFADVGYLRWDLALDASQYGPAHALGESLPFHGTWASFPVTLSMSYQLKPNTTLANQAICIPPSQTQSVGQAVNWIDCVEHFSGFNASTSNASLSSTLDCQRTSPNNTAGIRYFADQQGSPPFNACNPVLITQNANQMTGTATIENMSVNGNIANRNMAIFNAQANKRMQVGIGLMKEPETSADRTGPFSANSIDSNTYDMKNTGLFSNIGYYKYTWGPIKVRRPGSLSAITNDVASASVTGRVAINMNMGFTPGSLVESSALSPAAASFSVPSRDCAIPASPHSCVVTGVFRAPGGGLLSQSFSPNFNSKRGASTLMGLPSGITAVSTPKIIEDTSQLNLTPTKMHIPARLRTFIRSADGNIYMSRFEGSTWRPWMSLGRPWTCSSSDTTVCSELRRPTSSTPLAPVYRPINPDNSSNQLQPYLDVGTTNVNDGISIASEPVVASYMEKNRVLANIGGPQAGGFLPISSVSIALGKAVIKFSGSIATCPGNCFKNGQTIFLSNFSLTSGNINGVQTVSNVPDAHTIEINAPTAQLASGSGLTSSSMITDSDPTLATFGMIGIFVRVSQIRSSDGRIGPLHNSVWYTFAKTRNAYVANQPWDFDRPEAWTHWMMVGDSTNYSGLAGSSNFVETVTVPNTFRIQGNPLVFIDNSQGTEQFYIFGTSAYANVTVTPWDDMADHSLSSAVDPTKVMLHPPIAPGMGINPYPVPNTPVTNRIWGYSYYDRTVLLNISVAGKYVNPNMDMHKNWYNYGMLLAYTSLDTSKIPNTDLGTSGGWIADIKSQFCPALMSCQPHGFAWNTVQVHNAITQSAKEPFTPAFAPNTLDQFTGVIASDWDYLKLTTSSSKTVVRLFAMELTQQVNPCWDLEPQSGPAFGLPVYNPPAGTPPLVAPCKYRRMMTWMDFTLDNSTANNNGVTNGLVFGCQGAYPSIDFLGTPHAINISNATQQASTDVLAGTVPGVSYKPALIFGRAVCRDKTKCDNTQPVISYATVNQDTECATPGSDQPYIGWGAYNPVRPHTMYHPGEAFIHNGTTETKNSSASPILSFSATADVVPTFSHAMKYSNNDASLFFITRDILGNSAHGFWDGTTDPSNNNQSGSQNFTILSSGPATN